MTKYISRVDFKIKVLTIYKVKNFIFLFLVAPVVKLPHDSINDTSAHDEKSDEAHEPTGDLAYLTANVTNNNEGGIAWGPLDEEGNMSGVILGTPMAAATPRPSDEVKYKGKGKGVGKGCSGSSGPPLKKKGKFQVPRRPENVSNQADVEHYESTAQDIGGRRHPQDQEGAVEPTAERYVGVGIKRGYTIYPSYLFDVPPKRLRIDHLRRKFMITEIARSHTQHRFYRRAITFMSCLKGFFRGYASKKKFQITSDGQQGFGDHDYAMPQSESSSEEDNTDHEGQI